MTARRREENIEKVPIAMTALSASQLAEQSIRTESDLQISVPGLTIRETGNQNQLTYSIRGQTIDQFSGSSPAVLVYYDEVQASSTVSTNLFDLQSIQVLEGPQGTLFGRNATGGAVLYQSAKPTGELGGYLQARSGNYGLYELQGAINLPLGTEAASLRIAADWLKADGYVRNVFSGSDLGDQDQKSARISLRLTPLENLTNSTVGQYSDIGGTNVAPALYSANGCGATNNGIVLASPAACLYGPAFPGFPAYLAAHPGAYAGGLEQFAALQRSRGPWTVDFNEPAANFTHSGYVSNTTQYNVQENLLLKNIFGYAQTLSRQQYDADGTPYNIFFYTPLADRRRGDMFDNRIVSDELQLQATTPDKKLNYILGAYYADERDETDFPLSAFDLSPIAPATSFEYHWRVRDTTRAIFSQGTYDLGAVTTGLKFTAGLRYTWERIGLRQLGDSIFLGAPSESQSLSHPSWTASLEYQATDRLLLYLSQRGSWRTGGFNGIVAPVSASGEDGGNQFRSETTEDVEIGSKFVGGIGDLPVQVNVDFYNQWIRDVQRTVYVLLNGNAASITANVPKAIVTGAELNSQIGLTSFVDLGASAAWSNARYTSPHVSVLGNNFTYGPYADTPRWSGSAFARLNLPAPPTLGKFALRADIYVQSHQYFSNLNSTVAPNTELAGYGLINLRLDWKSALGSHLDAALYVKNLTDHVYYTGGLPQGAGLGVNLASGGQPRRFGGELHYSF